MIVVADSSTLVVLVRTGCEHVLPALFGRIVIPPEVAAEVAAPHRPEVVRGFMTTPPAWLEIRPPASVEDIAGLHAGEKAAISLALEISADRLIIDERSGRKAATARRIPIVGTIGVLEIAAQNQLIDLGRAFEAVKRTDFWVSPKFLDERLSLFRKHELDRKVEHAQEPPAPHRETPPKPGDEQPPQRGFRPKM